MPKSLLTSVVAVPFRSASMRVTHSVPFNSKLEEPLPLRKQLTPTPRLRRATMQVPPLKLLGQPGQLAARPVDDRQVSSQPPLRHCQHNGSPMMSPDHLARIAPEHPVPAEGRSLPPRP